jgi:hypothetical protein
LQLRQGHILSESSWEEFFHAFLLAPGIAGNSWHMLTYKWITLISASIIIRHFPCVCLCLLMAFSLCAWLSLWLFSYKVTSYVKLGAPDTFHFMHESILTYNLNIYAKTLLPNEVTLTNSWD